MVAPDLTLTLAPSPEKGCPSGLAPAASLNQGAADPSAFVRTDEAGLQRLELMVRGAKCAGCISKIEGGLLALAGVEDARLNLSTGRLAISWREGPTSARAVTQAVIAMGYGATPFDPQAARRAVDTEGRMLLRCLAVAAFGMMNIMMVSIPVWAGHGEMGDGARTFFHWVGALIAIPCALYAAQPFFSSAYAALIKRRANMDVPISLGVLLTIAISISETLQRGAHAYFDSVLMLLFFLLIGRYLDHRLRERARAAAQELLALQAVTAQRFGPDGALTAIPARDVAIGDRLQLSAGDRAPVDAVIETGTSDLDRAMLTGETDPVPARPGDAIQAGVINLSAPLTIQATATADRSALAELARLIEMGEQSRSTQMRLADHAARLYVPIVHSLALGTFLGWLVLPSLLAQWGLMDITPIGVRGALLNAVAVLIITCPCALGLAAPAVQVVATGRLFKRGVFVKSGDALERLAQVDTVLMDKTGTLTLGRPRLLNAQTLPPGTLATAAQLARGSRHPLSRAVVEAAGPGRPALDMREIPGMGLEAILDGQRVRLGQRAFAAPDAAPAPAGAGQSELWLSVQGESSVRLAFMDALRPDAHETIARLKALGLTVELASGDRPEAVAAAAREAGIEAFAGGLSPADKIARHAALKAQGKRVLMVGDGLNDAAVLAAAHASASPGSAVDASQAAADLVIQGTHLGPLVEAIEVARKSRRLVLENFGLSVGYNLIAVPIAVIGLVTPLVAAIAMAGSSLLVTANALRLQGGKATPWMR